MNRALTIGLLLVLSCCGVAQADFTEQMRLGLEAVNRDQPSVAATAFQEAVRLDPSDPQYIKAFELAKSRLSED